MHTQTHTQTDTLFATRFFVVDEHDRITYMPIAYCDRYTTVDEAYAWGRDMQGLFDGFTVETVTR